LTEGSVVPDSPRRETQITLTLGASSTQPCVACGSNEFRSVFDDLSSPEGQRYSLRQCCRCGLGITDPQPSEDELRRLYQSEYYRTNETGPRNALTRLGRFLVRRVLRGHDPLLGSAQRGRILDMGCGNGEFLRRMGELGWETYGTDSSPAAVQLATRFARDVRLARASEPVFEEKQFDVVTMFNVFEHVPDPIETLVEVRRILKDGGTLILEVPNVQSLAFRIVKRNWIGLDVPRHLYHYSPKALIALAQAQGFQVERFRGFKFLPNLYIVYQSLANAIFSPDSIALFDPAFERAKPRTQMRILVKSLVPLLLTVPIVLAERISPARGESMDVVLRKGATSSPPCSRRR
jgi:2-polyprenyl-3-methyl-5-hydroxy-6-metoxy-1,4-benzoquinol methylase